MRTPMTVFLACCMSLLIGCQNHLGPFEGLTDLPPTTDSPVAAPFETAPALAAQNELLLPPAHPTSDPIPGAPARPNPVPAPAPSPTPTPASPATAGGLLFRSDLPFDTVLAEATSKGRPVLMYFETQRCGWCDRLKSDTFSKPEVRNRIGAGFVAVRYDAGRTPGRELARRYGMPGYPVIVVTDAAGAELGRVVGYREAHALLGELARY